MARLGVKIISYLLMMALVLIVLPLPPTARSLSGAEEVMRTRGTIIVNASGGGDYTHIQWAIDNATNGDEIHVMDGTYYENIIINKSISLIGTGWENTTIICRKNVPAIHVIANYVNITGFNVTHDLNKFEGKGIYVDHANNCRISDNNCVYNTVGIYLDRTNGNTIMRNIADITIYFSSDNTISNNVRGGINIYDSRNNIIMHNTIIDDGITISGRGVWYWNTNMIGTSNTVNGKPVYLWKNRTEGQIPLDAGQVILANCSNIIIENLNISNVSVGINIAYSNRNFIINNTANSNRRNGIRLAYSSGNTVINNSFISNERSGIYLHTPIGNTIKNNIVNSNRGDGIFLYNSHDSTIENNTVNLNGMDGINLKNSERNLILKNICNWNNYAGISGGGTITNNTCTSNNEAGISGGGTITNNTCTSNNGAGISGSGIITNNICKSNNGPGIRAGGTIANNICTFNNDDGIYISGGGNTITDNICSNNNRSGLGLGGSTNSNILTNNTCNNNTWSGIFLMGSRGNLLKNNICTVNKQDGISVDWASNSNTIINNTCQSNARYAVSMTRGSTKNAIYHNNFIDNNNRNIQALDNVSENKWYNINEGNYWSDWTEPDDNFNGIVDIRYNIYGTAYAQDPFPLVNPSGTIIPIPAADAGSDVIIDMHQSVTFNSSGCLNTDFIVNYTWSFTYDNKAQFLYGPSPIFTFHTVGIYEITLQVFNYLDQGTDDPMIVTVEDIAAPIANAGPDITINQHQTALFDATISFDNVAITNFSWTFRYDDSNISLYGIRTAFTFHVAGIYSIILTVSDAEGNWATDALNVTVRDITPPNAYAGPDIIINQSDIVFFTLFQNISNDVCPWNTTWTFNYNGTEEKILSLISSVPHFRFEIPGTYVVITNFSDMAGNWASDTFYITVLSIPEELDSDNDTYNDTYELSQGSDPNNPLSTPFDLDADGWNNSVETQVGSDPFNNLSIPRDADGDGIPDSIDPDRDGDGVANVDDPYPDDGDKWEGPKTIEEEEGSVWWLVGAVVVVLVLGVIVGMVLVTRRRRGRKEIGEEEMKDGGVDDFGRVGKVGGGEEEVGEERDG